MLLHCGLYVDAPGLLRETPLHLAARNGFKDLVDVLIQRGGNVNSRNLPMQETPLHLASQNGHQHIAEFLIQRGSHINARNFPMQETPLHLATRHGHQHIAEYLIQHGGHVNARNFPMQETPLHLATRHGDQRIAEFLIQHGSHVSARNVPWQDTPLHIAAKNGHRRVAEVLIQHGGDPNARNKIKQVPLHLAAQNGHKHVAAVLIRHGSDVNAKNVLSQDTPLHLAAENGHKHVVEVLLQHGSDVNTRNNRRLMLNQFDAMMQLQFFLQHGFDTTVYVRNTPLHLAAENGHRQVAEDLILHGSDVNAENNLRQSPLHLAAQHGHKCVAEVLIKHGSYVNTGWQTPLHLAALNGHKDISELLIQQGSDVNARSVQSQRTPLHYAAKEGQKQVAELLIRHGSNVTAKDSLQHFTPLHLAAQNGHKRVAEVFIQHGGDVNARSRQEDTPLHIASANGHKDVANLLMQHGSNVNASNVPWKSTPLHFAVENGHKEIAELLIQFGSDVSAKNNRELTPIYVAARDDYNRIVDVFIQHGSDARHMAFEYEHKHIPEVLIQREGGTTSQDNAKERTFDLASESELQLLPEVLMHRGLNKLFQTLSLCVATKKRQSGSGVKPLKVMLEKLKTQSQQVNLSDPVTWNPLIDVRSEARLGSISRKRLRLAQSHSKQRKTSLLYRHVHSLFTEEPLDLNTVDKRFRYSESNDHDKASNARCLLHHRVCVSCGCNTDRTMHQFSAIGEANISFNSNAFNSPDNSVGEVLSWPGLVSGFTGNSAQDSTNIGVLMDNEQVSFYYQKLDVKTLLLVAIVAMCLMMCLILWYKYKHQLRVCFNHKRGGKKEEESTTEGTVANSIVTQNQHKEESMIELRMQRVRSWLACDFGQEESLSVESGGNINAIVCMTNISTT